MSGKSQNFIDLLPSASRNENFVSTGENILKNRNWTFPVVGYISHKNYRLSQIFCKWFSLETISCF